MFCLRTEFTNTLFYLELNIELTEQMTNLNTHVTFSQIAIIRRRRRSNYAGV